MDVTIFTTVIYRGGDPLTQHFISDGEGPDIEVESASVAAAVARYFDYQNGCEIAFDVAMMWTRHGATQRQFIELEESKELNDGKRIHQLFEYFMDDTTSEEPIFAVLDQKGSVKEVSRNLPPGEGQVP